MTQPWYQPFVKARDAIIVLAAHALTAVAVVIFMELLNVLLRFLPFEILLFDRWPVRYIFDFADVLILAVFIGFGTIEAFRVFGGHNVSL